jgi:hypothetical protein
MVLVRYPPLFPKFYLLSFIHMLSDKPLTDNWLLGQLDIFLRGRTGRLLVACGYSHRIPVSVLNGASHTSPLSTPLLLGKNFVIGTCARTIDLYLQSVVRHINTTTQGNMVDAKGWRAN